MKNKRVVSFGEILLRLTPQNKSRLTEAIGFDCCYGGSEANVMIALSSMGDETSYLTVLPDNGIGKAAERNLHRYGVRTDEILFKGDILGSYYFEQGFGALNSQVIYNRRYSEIARVDGYEDSFDFDRIFAGCDLFHISGITFALSEACRELCFTFLREAKKRHIPVSFDFNYRGKLWSIEDAAKTYREVVPLVDILFCSRRDLEAFLGTSEQTFYDIYDCEYLVIREREIVSADRHRAGACIYHHAGTKVEKYECKEREFAVLDRVGSGDAFSAGVLHALLQDGEDIRYAVEFGMSAFVLKHYVAGDILTMTEAEILNFLQDENKDVNR